MSQAVHIGYCVLTQSHTFRRTFETAAWYEDVLVAPGTYPVMGHFDARGVLTSYPQATIYLPGIVTASDFTSQFGGVPYGNQKDKNVGQESSYLFSAYGYDMARFFAVGGYPESAQYHLLPGFVLESAPAHYDDGREFTRYSIRRAG